LKDCEKDLPTNGQNTTKSVKFYDDNFLKSQSPNWQLCIKIGCISERDNLYAAEKEALY